ncbi:hypothetical protein [Nostoc sp. C110]|uniref:NACHT C-terminal helical domain 2-containing protein n=1 Tax=Nostoc sp. C110 TaxID=3349876 RepID=UPI00370DB950
MKLLRPFLEDERNRRPFLVLALGNDEPVLQHISWGGAVAIFIPDMMCKLADYGEVAPGKQAIWALLEYVRSQVGVDVQQHIDNLRPLLDVRSRSDSFGVSPSSTATDTTSIDVLVQKVRDRLHDDIQRSHGTMPVLGVDHWVDNELLILMKHKIDNLVASSRIIQQFLEWIHEKSCSFKGRIRQTMARAFYYALTTSFEGYIESPDTFNSSLIMNLTGFIYMDKPVIASESFDNTFGKALDLESILSQPSNAFLGFALSLNFSYELKQAIQELLNQVPSQFIKNQHFEYEWWQQNQPEFIIKLRIIMVKYCNIGHDWQFSNRQKQLLNLYWDYNKFIVELLNKDNCISDQVREEIEDNLLLPIAEIEKRKRER